jgi:hypothetical protein
VLAAITVLTKTTLTARNHHRNHPHIVEESLPPLRRSQRSKEGNLDQELLLFTDHLHHLLTTFMDRAVLTTQVNEGQEDTTLLTTDMETESFVTAALTQQKESEVFNQDTQRELVRGLPSQPTLT